MFRRNLNQGNRFGGPMQGFPNQMFDGQQMQYGQGMFPGQPGQGQIFPQVSFERLQFEIMENRRRISNLTKRIIRLENYLRIRDTSDYVNIDEDHIPNEFSM